MDAVAVLFFFRAPFSRMVQSPPKHFSGWQTVFVLASLQICSIQLWGIGGRRLGPAKSKGPWPSRLLMDGKLLAMLVRDVESKPCRDAA